MTKNQKEPAPVAPPEAPTPPPAPTTVKVRVLVDCTHGRCDDVVELDADLAKSLPGQVDPHPEAVAYAESLKK